MDTTSVKRKIESLPFGAGELDELASDLRALGGAESGAAERWVTRPAVLRRVARAFAEQVPQEVTRVVVGGEQAAAVGAALSLITGLPFVVVDTQGRVKIGEQHEGETVATFAIHAEDLPAGSHESGAAAVARSLFGTPPVGLFDAWKPNERELNA